MRSKDISLTNRLETVADRAKMADSLLEAGIQMSPKTYMAIIEEGREGLKLLGDSVSLALFGGHMKTTKAKSRKSKTVKAKSQAKKSVRKSSKAK